MKIVRDAMNQMLDAWKSLPDSFADEDDADGTVKVPISQSASLYKGKNCSDPSSIYLYQSHA